MEIVIVVLVVLGIAVASQALAVRSIRQNENVDIPITLTKSIWKHWDEYLEPEVKRKYQLQYAGWVILFIAIGVLAVWIFEL